MVSRFGGAGSTGSKAWMVAGFATIVVVALTDLLVDERAILIEVLVAAPLLASAGASPPQTAVVGGLAIAASFPLAAQDGIWGTSDQLIRTLVVVIGSIAAVVSAVLRARRDRELAVARPQALDAQRLRLALDGGEMGTWRWDLASGRVSWDTRLEGLYGLDAGEFDGTFATYESLIHPDDRDRVRRIVDAGITNDAPWRVDHRVQWRDGTVHWLEGRGEPVHDAWGTITGAAGISINIDQRRALLDAQTRATEAAERSSQTVRSIAEITTALAGASTIDEVGEVIVTRAAAAVRAQAGYFATVDLTNRELVARAHSGYDRIIDRYGRLGLDEPYPLAIAVRTGTTIFVESPDERMGRFPEFPALGTSDAFICAPVLIAGEARGVLSFGFEQPRLFDNDDRAFVTAMIDACEQALERAVAYESEQQALARLRVLLDSSETLGALDDPEKVVEAIAGLAANRIGTWATVVRIRADGRLERSAVAHRNPALAPVVRKVMERLTDGNASLTRVIETGEPIVFHGLSDDAAHALEGDDTLRAELEQIGYASCLLVPISIAGRRLAVLSIGDDRPELLSAAHVELAVDLGRRGGSALERASLWQLNRERLEAEHRIVEMLQRTIVPDRLPTVPGVDLAAAYRPAEVDIDVGGDWYDAFVTPDDAMVIVVADVAGHGIQAASLMGRVRNALRAYAIENSEPASILLRLHRLIRSQDVAEMVTAFVARVDPAMRKMSWSRAGHPPPLLVSPTGEATWLDHVNGAPLGTMAREYSTAEIDLAAGSLLVCYTDGLIERRDRVLDAGLEWLLGRVRDYQTEELETLCDKLVGAPFAPHPAPDDLCVLALRITE